MLRRIAIDLLDTYVGHQAGKRILSGHIRRGDSETIAAAIWLSDMRGFTALADRLPPQSLLDLLNRYFDCQTPAIIVNVDGDPIWSPIKDNDLKYAVNTNWDLFQHGTSSTLYLRNEKSWMTAADLKGPWTPAGTLPDSFKKLPADENWKDVKAAVPGVKQDAKRTPKVFVSSTPAELILLNGAPSYQQVAGTNLMWINNTDSDLFRAGRDGLVGLTTP